MKQMVFSTQDPNCELFLTAQGVGFLMMTANGFISRKWHGLTMGDHSVFANLALGFSHQDKTFPLTSAHWISTQRDTYCITRQWRSDCGCQLTETWDWSHPQRGLVVSFARTDDSHCSHPNKRSSTFSARPHWTMEYAGTHTCGCDRAKELIKQLSPHKVSAHLPDKSGQLEIAGYPDESVDAGAWYTMEKPLQGWLSTQKDASRGEHHEREYFSTHEFRATLTRSSNITLVISHPIAPSRQPDVSDANRMAKSTWLECENKALETACTNSIQSLNQLIQVRPDGTIGLQAGLPWFTQFWTRDLCHSFRAAFLWSNRTADAEELVTRLWQKSRGTVVPNFTTTHATAENSIDALPLLLLSTADLVDHIGLTERIVEVLPEIKERLGGTAKAFLEKKLVEHRDADTWMDAQRWTQTGQLIACSPRSNRAFEIQAFWLAALSRWQVILSHTEHAEHSEWITHLGSAVQQGVATVRERYFEKSTNRWADTLRPNNTQDFSVRPNVMLGLQALDRAHLLEQLISPDELKSYLETLIELDLITQYGVRTLSPETSVRHHMPINSIFKDESAYIHENKIHFHPYHEFGSRHGLEHPDWAYHNGTIWPWLSHSACQLLFRAGLSEHAHPLVETLIYHSNKGTQGGALPELLDGLSSHSPWSWPKGAPHQAWSVSAFIHIIFENILGLRLGLMGQELTLNSSHWNYFHLAKTSLSTPQGTITFDKSRHTIHVMFEPTDEKGQITLRHIDIREPGSTERFTLNQHHREIKLNLTHK